MIGDGNDDNDRIVMMLISIRKYKGVQNRQTIFHQEIIAKVYQSAQRKKEKLILHWERKGIICKCEIL